MLHAPHGLLMVVSDRRRCRTPDWVGTLVEAARGGAGLVQLREKDLPDDDVEAVVRRLMREAPPDVRIVVNARPGLAERLGVGLHLPGDAAMPPEAAVPFWGRSVHDPEEARRAAAAGADYLVAGTIYPTMSKPGRPGAGPGHLRRIVEAAGEVPVLAIGGIRLSSIPEVVRTGARGVAVCGGILGRRDPRQAAEAYALALRVALGHPTEVSHHGGA